jgi:hypothetical protein
MPDNSVILATTKKTEAARMTTSIPPHRVEGGRGPGAWA